MNSQLIQQGRAAYRAGDFSAAAQMLGAAKTPDEIMGEADHLRGNALMHLGMYAEAAEAYAAALNDGTYGKRGALLTNRGKALAAVGDYTTAAQAFSAATQDASYATPFKAYLGLGNALFQSGDYANAGTAFRQAAIDGAIRLLPPHSASLVVASLSSAVRRMPWRPTARLSTLPAPATTRVRSTPAWVRHFLPPAAPPTHSTPLTPLLPMASTSHLRAGR